MLALSPSGTRSGWFVVPFGSPRKQGCSLSNGLILFTQMSTIEHVKRKRTRARAATRQVLAARPSWQPRSASSVQLRSTIKGPIVWHPSQHCSPGAGQEVVRADVFVLPSSSGDLGVVERFKRRQTGSWKNKTICILQTLLCLHSFFFCFALFTSVFFFFDSAV